MALFIALRFTQNVMHPPSPILNSEAPRIQLYFVVLFALTLLAAWQVARWWYEKDLFEQATTTNHRSAH